MVNNRPCNPPGCGLVEAEKAGAPWFPQQQTAAVAADTEKFFRGLCGDLSTQQKNAAHIRVEFAFCLPLIFIIYLLDVYYYLSYYLSSLLFLMASWLNCYTGI